MVVLRALLAVGGLLGQHMHLFPLEWPHLVIPAQKGTRSIVWVLPCYCPFPAPPPQKIEVQIVGIGSNVTLFSSLCGATLAWLTPSEIDGITWPSGELQPNFRPFDFLPGLSTLTAPPHPGLVYAEAL